MCLDILADIDSSLSLSLSLYLSPHSSSPSPISPNYLSAHTSTLWQSHEHMVNLLLFLFFLPFFLNLGILILECSLLTVTVNLNCSLSLRVLGKPSYSWRRNLIYLSETIAQSRSRKRDNLGRENEREYLQRCPDTESKNTQEVYKGGEGAVEGSGLLPLNFASAFGASRAGRGEGGRGRGSPLPAREAPKAEAKFKGSNPDPSTAPSPGPSPPL